MKLSVKTYGGVITADSLITDIGQFAKACPVWYNTLSGGLMEKLISFIGTTREGRLPIWELLPVDNDGETTYPNMKAMYAAACKKVLDAKKPSDTDNS